MSNPDQRIKLHWFIICIGLRIFNLYIVVRVSCYNTDLFLKKFDYS